ncbi:MAG: cryptochrome/photolyase family protein [Proteobacteria bacterium]|nr:cryptochrome/photolyase family protein [Pseudomonadota bacterium]NDC23959.1 cryptochrome/photolyase family protein [Pseudomonadota bacterium]NDD03998.1 cryptochrome/photolyase family protein [Pseudomonadota bacterium]
MKTARLILGNQLFPQTLKKTGLPAIVFMAEDYGLCTHFKYHKHKIILFLTAMRRYAEALRQLGVEVHYDKLTPSNVRLSYEDKLHAFIKTNRIDRLVTFDIEDKFMEDRLQSFAQDNKLPLAIEPSPMFLTSRTEFQRYLSKTKKPFMKTFYESQRKGLKVLLEKDGSPTGGKWSFDTENRKKLVKGLVPPGLPPVVKSKELEEVTRLTDELFSQHYGNSCDFWLPTSRQEALTWLKQFTKERLSFFGDYEDAVSQRSDFVYHSVLTPSLNLGLITPQEVIDFVLAEGKKNKIPLNSLEGFIRQVIGWREFIRGIYQNFSQIEDQSNFWNHRRQLSNHWYEGTTGLPPLDYVIKKTIRLSYAHHIERLMILGNFMLLCEVEPREAHRWFMELFVDSSDWVMGPNVYGMALFSDGGIFSTKPYFCGSNYLLKMGDFEKGPWCDIADGLFWTFIKKHESFFLKNPRLSMMARSLKKMKPERFNQIEKLANEFKTKVCPLK